MAEDSEVAGRVANIHESLRDTRTEIGEMEDGVTELQRAWEAVTEARAHIAEFAKRREDVDEEEVLVK